MSNKNTKSGWLDVETTLTLHTRNAQRLFLGRSKNVPNVAKFNRLIQGMQDASKKDDPFADWILLRTYDAIVQTHRKLHSFEATVKKHLTPTEGITLKLACHHQPRLLSIHFCTTYTVALMYVLNNYDRLVRSQYALKSSIIKQDKILESNAQIANNLLQQILIEPTKWHKTGVTRLDITDNTLCAQEAFKLYETPDALPDTVITTKLRAPNNIELEDL